MKPFRIRHDNPFDRPHLRPGYTNYNFNSLIEEGPRKDKTSVTRTTRYRMRKKKLR